MCNARIDYLTALMLILKKMEKMEEMNLHVLITSPQIQGAVLKIVETIHHLSELLIKASISVVLFCV